jgi:predicted enzyme related to lactoylglutathione lyase
MAETITPAKPVWVDLASGDAAAARAFYSELLGWTVTVNPDPQYGGYARATVDGKDVAGIGPKQAAEMPSVWSLYIGTTDANALAAKVVAAGGTVVAPPFPVGDQGAMAVFQDPSGAFISAWQALAMGGFESGAPGSFAWAELNARGIGKAVAFYGDVFGWAPHETDMPDGSKYVEFQVDGQSIVGGQEMMAMVPPQVPSYWLVYFGVADVDASFARVLELGGREMLSPMDFPGGRFAIVSDQEGAAFGLLRMA